MNTIALAPLALALLAISPAPGVAIVQEGDALPMGTRVVVTDGARPAHGGWSHAEILRVALAAHPIRVVGAFGLSDAADAFGPFRATLFAEGTWTAETADIVVRALWGNARRGESPALLTWGDVDRLCATWRWMEGASPLFRRRVERVWDHARAEVARWRPLVDFRDALTSLDRAIGAGGNWIPALEDMLSIPGDGDHAGRMFRRIEGRPVYEAAHDREAVARLVREIHAAVA